MDALLSDINQAGLGRSLQFELFRPGQVSVKEYYAELPIAVRVTGRYHDIGAFAADIANLSRIVTLNNLNLVPAKDGNLVMDTTAKTFRYLDPGWPCSARAPREPKMRFNNYVLTGSLVLTLLALAGCGSSEQEELQQWMTDQRNATRPKVDPLPEPTKFSPQA